MSPIHYVLIFGGILALYIISGYFINLHKGKLVYDEIEAFCLKENYTYQKVKNKNYDLVISTPSWEMFLKICTVPKNSSVTINSKATWCLRFGGGKRKGRNYPSKRYLNELIPFLNSNVISSDEAKISLRVVVFCPSTEVILKYINESDIVEVKPSHLSHGYKAIKYSDFYQCFNELLEVKK